MKKKFYLKDDIDKAFELTFEGLEDVIKKYLKDEEYSAVVSFIDIKKGMKTFQEIISRLRTFDVECEEQEK